MSITRLPPLPTIREIVRLYKIRAVKQLSQNFLLNEHIINKIVKQAGLLKDSTVIEVGPGPGGITRSIMKKSPKRVILVEKDYRFQSSLEMLQEVFTLENRQMDIHYKDILRTDLSQFFAEDERIPWETSCRHIHIIGNLPFNISTPLVIQWFNDIAERSKLWSLGRVRMTLTFQKEVAERLVAKQFENQRCRLSLVAQAFTQPTLRFIIPGSAFLPKPDVDVGVVTFEPLVTPQTTLEFDFFVKFVRHLFSFRQKYAIRCMETLFPLDRRKELALLLFKLADLDPTTRPCHFSIAQVNKLASAYEYLLERNPELSSYNYRASRTVLSSKFTKDIQVEDYA